MASFGVSSDEPLGSTTGVSATERQWVYDARYFKYEIILNGEAIYYLDVFSYVPGLIL
jgi:hypothetical protein